MRKKRLAIDFLLGKCYTVTNNGNFGGYTIMKKMKNWMAFFGTKNLIAIGALLVLVIAISVGIAISNSKTDKKANDEVEESSGLQVEENADDVEGDSIDFSEFQTEEEKKNDASNKQEGSDKTQTGNGGQSGSGSGSGNGGLTESPSEGGNGDSGNGNGGTTSSGSEFGPLF